MNRRAQLGIGMAALFGVILGSGMLPGEAEARGRVKLSVKSYADCEDTLKTPCVTFDEGEWRKVTSYKPYRAKSLRKCRTIRLSVKSKPCVIPHKDNWGKFWVISVSR